MTELRSGLIDTYHRDMSLAATHIELRLNRAGQPRAFIAGTRVRVQDVHALAEVRGASPDEIVEALPHLTLGQVHAAISYYFDHRDEVLQEMQEDDEYVRRFKESRGPAPLQRRLEGDVDNGGSVSS